jgi:tripartite-type tricarboxylate transporter receptor subunit TctC
VLVGFPPGQASDIIARAYAEELGKSLGQPVIVENRPGAGATIAAEMAARAPADGYTLLYSSSGPLAIAPPHVREAQTTTRSGISSRCTRAASCPTSWSSTVRRPTKTLQELVAQGRGANGAAINYGSGGNGTTSHLAMEMLKAEGGLKFTHVPYKGSVPALNDLAAGAVQVVLETVSATLPYVKNGKARILGISMTRRHPELPDVMPIAEVVPGYESAAWGMFITPDRHPGADRQSTGRRARADHPDAGHARAPDRAGRDHPRAAARAAQALSCNPNSSAGERPSRLPARR